MESNAVDWTEREEELSNLFAEAMDNKDTESALLHVHELITIREEHPVYHFWLGDCYRISAQFDKALESYRKALDLDEQYAVGEDFREVTKGYIDGLKLIIKAMQLFEAKEYEKAIHCVDEFIKIDPEWGDIYILRGHCNELLGKRVQALRDYHSALNGRISETVKPKLDDLSESTKLKSLNLIIDELIPASSSAGKSNLVQEYIKLLKSIEGLLLYYPEIADLPGYDRFCKDIDELKIISNRTKGKAIIIGIDEDGVFIVNQETLKNKRMKRPERKYLYSAVVEDMEQSQANMMNMSLGSRLVSQNSPITESKRKELERKRRYYQRHKADLSAKQNEYDEKHKAQIHFKNKFYYMLKNNGASKPYMMKDVVSKEDEDFAYHQLSNE